MADTEQDLFMDEVLKSVEPVAKAAYDRHIDTSKGHWQPQDYVPFGVREEIPEMTEAALSGLYVFGQTEDNIAHYNGLLRVAFMNGDSVWADWRNRWTMEEDRHARVIQRYIEHTGVIQVDWLENARSHQIGGGEVPDPVNATETLIYTAVQEPLTNVAHRSLAKEMTDKMGKTVFARVAGDETRHRLFYHEVAGAIRENYPDHFAVSAANKLIDFDMPGTGIDDFLDHAQIIAAAGIFNLGSVNKAITDALKSWRFDDLEQEVKTDEAKEAVEKVQKAVVRMGRAARRYDRDIIDIAPTITWQEGKAVKLQDAA